MIYVSMTDKFLEAIVTAYSLDKFFFCTWAILCLVFHIGERVLPAESNQSYRSMVTNVRITLVYAIVRPTALLGANYFAGTFMATVVNRLWGPWFAVDLSGLEHGRSGLVKLILLVAIAFVPLLIYDFFYYWFHRLQHANSWLWEQHKLHHSDHALNVTTSYRLNWLEDFLKGLLVSTPVAIVLGLAPVDVGIVALMTTGISGIWGQFLHSNIRLSFSFLSSFVTGPQFHRIHHSIETRHQNKNFTTYFPIWDVLFGTYYRPARDEYPKTGVIGEPSDPSMREILIGPFLRWGNRVTASAEQLVGKVTAKVKEACARAGDAADQSTAIQPHRNRPRITLRRLPSSAKPKRIGEKSNGGEC